MSDSGVAGQSSGINRKAAAIFQQQAAGLTGYTINTELTAGIGPQQWHHCLQSGHHRMSW